MNSYIIAVDENGQAYLSHAIAAGAGAGGRRGVRQNHKYILKIGEGRVARYFYTPEEVAAYKRELQGAAKKSVESVKNKVKEATGYGAKERLSANKQNYINAGKEYKKAEYEANAAHEKANKAALKAMENNLRTYTSNVFNKNIRNKTAELSKIKADEAAAERDAAFKKRDEARNKYDSAFIKEQNDKRKYERSLASKVDKVKDKLGYDERDRRDAAIKSNEKIQKVAEDEIRKGTDKISKSIHETDKQKSDELFERGINQRDMAINASERSRNKVAEAEKAYDKTLLGKAENTKEFIKDKATDAELATWEAGKKVKDAGKSVKDAVDNAAFEVEYAAEKAINNVTGNKDAAERDYYLKAIKNAKKEAEGAGENRNEFYYKPLIERLQEKADAADKRYKNSTVGKAKSKADRMKEEFRKATDKVKDAVSNKPTRPELSSPNNPIETEKIIKENVIEETKIPEQHIEEKVIKDKKHKYPNTHKINADGRR